MEIWRINAQIGKRKFCISKWSKFILGFFSELWVTVSLFTKARLRWGKECQDYRIEAVTTTGQLAKKPAAQLKVQWGKLPSWIKKTSTAYVIHYFLSFYWLFYPTWLLKNTRSIGLNFSTQTYLSRQCLDGNHKFSGTQVFYQCILLFPRVSH